MSHKTACLAIPRTWPWCCVNFERGNGQVQSILGLNNINHVHCLLVLGLIVMLEDRRIQFREWTIRSGIEIWLRRPVQAQARLIGGTNPFNCKGAVDLL